MNGQSANEETTGSARADRHLVRIRDGVIEVIVAGEGASIVLLPSLGRGAEDFVPIATRLVAAGFRVLCPQPRGIGASRAPMSGVTLADYAADIATVIEADGNGRAFLVGHAFGNRVARLLATKRSELTRAVALVAANVGRAPSPPHIRAAIRASADPGRPQEERLAALRAAFFAPGNDPRRWLDGWYPEVLAAQRIAGDLTPREEDYAAGSAPVLYLRPEHDPLAHAEDAAEFQRALGSRVTVQVIRGAGHAAIAEQPTAVADALIAYARKLGGA